MIKQIEKDKEKNPETDDKLNQEWKLLKVDENEELLIRCTIVVIIMIKVSVISGIAIALVRVVELERNRSRKMEKDQNYLR